MPGGYGDKQIAYMRKYAQATADHQRWLEDKLQPHREKHLASLLAAEAKYKETVEADPDPTWDPHTAGTYSKYWQQNGPALIGYLLSWREMDARKAMEDEIAAADRQFEIDTAELYSVYEARLKQTIERLGRDNR